MMNKTSKFKKSLGATVFALAAFSSLSLVAFAQEAKAVPMEKLTASQPAAVLTEAKEVPAENITVLMQTRTNETTGKLEISEDNGVTWSEFDGKAFALTPATPVAQQ